MIKFPNLGQLWKKEKGKSDKDKREKIWNKDFDAPMFARHWTVPNEKTLGYIELSCIQTSPLPNSRTTSVCCHAPSSSFTFRRSKLSPKLQGTYPASKFIFQCLILWLGEALNTNTEY